MGWEESVFEKVMFDFDQRNTITFLVAYEHVFSGIILKILKELTFLKIL